MKITPIEFSISENTIEEMSNPVNNNLKTHIFQKEDYGRKLWKEYRKCHRYLKYLKAQVIEFLGRVEQILKGSYNFTTLKYQNRTRPDIIMP